MWGRGSWLSHFSEGLYKRDLDQIGILGGNWHFRWELFFFRWDLKTPYIKNSEDKSQAKIKKKDTDCNFYNFSLNPRTVDGKIICFQGGHYLEKPGETMKNLEFQIGTLKTLKKYKTIEKPWKTLKNTKKRFLENLEKLFCDIYLNTMNIFVHTL